MIAQQAATLLLLCGSGVAGVVLRVRRVGSAVSKAATLGAGAAERTLSALGVLGGALLLAWNGEEAHFFVGQGERTYDRDLFAFVFGGALVWAASVGMREVSEETREARVAHRHQTEEWKGWMQIFFLLYHYFHAEETYNMIRVFIAACVGLLLLGPHRCRPRSVRPSSPRADACTDTRAGHYPFRLWCRVCYSWAVPLCTFGVTGPAR